MSKLTITEALAEIKTIEKRIAKKREFVLAYLYRQEQLKDPHQAAGGTKAVIDKELQAIDDLQERRVGIRRAIAKANSETQAAVNGDSRTISDWLTWKREIVPTQQQFYQGVRQNITNVRQEAQRRGVASVAAEASAKPGDIIVNVDEKKLQEDIDHLESLIGTLDGVLSLKNATTTIDI